MAPGHPPTPPRLPLPGHVASEKRPCHCHFCLPPGWGALSVIHMMVSLGSNPQGHKGLWQGCQLDLSPCSNSGWGPLCNVRVQAERALCPVCSEFIWDLSVSQPCRLGPALCSMPVLHSMWHSRPGGMPGVGPRRSLHGLDFLPVLCSFVPSGKIEDPASCVEPNCPLHRNQPLAEGH